MESKKAYRDKKSKALSEVIKCKNLNNVSISSESCSGQSKYVQKLSTGDVDFYKCMQCPYMTLSIDDIEFHWQTSHASGDNINNKKKPVNCPGCFGLFYCRNLLEVHLRSHHKMGSKHVRKLAVCLVEEVEKNRQRQQYIQNLQVVIQDETLPPLIEVAADPSLFILPPVTVDADQRKEKMIKPLAKRGRPHGAKTSGIPSRGGLVGINHLRGECGDRCGIGGCGVRLISPEKMITHRACHAEGGRDLSCLRCGVLFSAVDTLHTHLWRVHDLDLELHACDRCPYRAYSLARLRNVHERIHSDERNYPCDSCDRAFKNSKQLANHRAVHRGPAGSHVCSQCGRRLGSRRRLERHTAAVHRGLRPHACALCSYAAATPASLRAHSRIHTGEKPFECHLCAYRSADGGSLRRHLQRHSHKKSYRCCHCAYSCIQASSLKRHLRVRHPLQAGKANMSPLVPSDVIQRGGEVVKNDYLQKVLNPVTVEHQSDQPSSFRDQYEVVVNELTQNPSEGFPTENFQSIVSKQSALSVISTNPGEHMTNLRRRRIDHESLMTLATQTSSAALPRKKPKISVKSNLILKGPDNLELFDLRRRIDFKSLNGDSGLIDPFFTLSIEKGNGIISSDVLSIGDSFIEMDSLNEPPKPPAEPVSKGGDIAERILLPDYLVLPDNSFGNVSCNDFYLPALSRADYSVSSGDTRSATDVKFESESYSSIQPEFLYELTNLNDTYLGNDSMTFEMPKHTIPVKFENKSDILRPYIPSVNTHELVNLQNVAIIEEVPASFDNSDRRRVESYDNDTVTDDISEDVKASTVFGSEPEFSKIIDETFPLVVGNSGNILIFNQNINYLAPKQKNANNQRTKEKLKIISEVHITSDESKMVNFVTVKNSGLKLEYPRNGASRPPFNQEQRT